MVGFGQMVAANWIDLPAKEIKDLQSSASSHLQEVVVKPADDGM